MRMKSIDKEELRELIINGISTEELNENHDYSGITDMGELLSGLNLRKYRSLIHQRSQAWISCSTIVEI